VSSRCKWRNRTKEKKRKEKNRT